MSDGCGHDHVDSFGSGAGRRVDVCMGCEQVIRFWVDWEALQDDESLRGATVSKLLTDAQLNSLVDHAEYGHLEGRDYEQVVKLIAEVRWLRAERSGIVSPEDSDLEDLATMILDTLHFEPGTCDAEVDDLVGVLRRTLVRDDDE